MKAPDYGNPRYREALEEQERLRSLLQREPLPPSLRFVAGADCSFNRFGKIFWGGFIVCDVQDSFRVVDRSVVEMEVDFPYLPGLLGFREVPVLCEAYARLATKPQVTLVDAHGTAHPRRFGSAAHLGVALGIPTAGCAKSRLCGEYEDPGEERGAWSALFLGGEIEGAVLRTRVGVAPVFVSPGHRCDLASAIALVAKCAQRYRIPQPIRLAHELVNEARRGNR